MNNPMRYCDDIFDGTGFEAIDEAEGCAGCAYVLGAAAALGVYLMGHAIWLNEARKKLEAKRAEFERSASA